MIVISDANIIFSCFYKPNGAIAILKEEEGYNICITTEELRAKTYKKLSK